MKTSQKVAELLQYYQNLITQEWINGIHKGQTLSTADIQDPRAVNIDNNLEAVKIKPMPVNSYVGNIWPVIDFCPKLEMLDFTLFRKKKLFLPKNMLDKFDQLKIINLSGLRLNYKQKLEPQIASLDQFFLAWRLKHGNCRGLITDNALLSDFQAFLKNQDLLEPKARLDINVILQKAKEYGVKFPEDWLILRKSIVKILDQLYTIDLSKIELNPKDKSLPHKISLDQFCLAWRLTHDSCRGLITDGASLNDFQKFLTDSSNHEMSKILEKAKKEGDWFMLHHPEEYKENDPFEQINSNMKRLALLPFVQEVFEVNVFHEKLKDAIKALDGSLSRIKSNPNSSVSEKNLLPEMDPVLVKAIVSLTPMQIFTLSHRHINNTKISAIKNIFYSIKNNLEIQNTEIKDRIENVYNNSLSFFVFNTVFNLFLSSSPRDMNKLNPICFVRKLISNDFGMYIDDEQLKRFILVVKKESEKNKKIKICQLEEVKEQLQLSYEPYEQPDATHDENMGEFQTKSDTMD